MTRHGLSLCPLPGQDTELLDGSTERVPHERAIEVLEQAVAAGERTAARLLASGYLERGRLIEAPELLGPLVAAGRDDLADAQADLGMTDDDAEKAYLPAVAEGDGQAMNNFALSLAEGAASWGNLDESSMDRQFGDSAVRRTLRLPVPSTGCGDDRK